MRNRPKQVGGRTNAPTKAPTNTPTKAKYIAINAFLIFHILAIACWCLPIDSPKAANTYIEATIVYKDGSRTTWTFPRMEQLSLTDRYFKERYRKYAENLPMDQNDALLPDAARYIARLNSTPSHPARTVMLIQKWSFIVPRADGSYIPEPWSQHILYGYGVKPEDLQ